MKNLIIINGTMGVGKTTVCLELQNILPSNVFLDGDWCWQMNPFVVNKETKEMVMQNITVMLNNFLSCSQFRNVLFCWVIHEQSILDEILNKLQISDCAVKIFTLMIDEFNLKNRLQKDIDNGIRTDDIINRSIPRLKNYDNINTIKIDTNKKSVQNIALEISNYLKGI